VEERIHIWKGRKNTRTINPSNSCNKAMNYLQIEESPTFLQNFDGTLELDSQTSKSLQSQGHHNIVAVVRLNHPDKLQLAAKCLA
jgi:hypothetical protein